MRLLTLLLMGIIPGLALSQTQCRVDLLQAHPYDTLQKYSYLIVSMRRGSSTLVPNGVSTGFFIQKGKKLYLVSANTSLPVVKYTVTQLASAIDPRRPLRS